MNREMYPSCRSPAGATGQIEVMRPAGDGGRPEVRPVLASVGSGTDSELVGIDVFVHAGISVDELVNSLADVNTQALQLQTITKNGVEVWPARLPETVCTEPWRCRFTVHVGSVLPAASVVELIDALIRADVAIIKTEKLFIVYGERGSGQRQRSCRPAGLSPAAARPASTSTPS